MNLQIKEDIKLNTSQEKNPQKGKVKSAVSDWPDIWIHHDIWKLKGFVMYGGSGKPGTWSLYGGPLL